MFQPERIRVTHGHDGNRELGLDENQQPRSKSVTETPTYLPLVVLRLLLDVLLRATVPVEKRLRMQVPLIVHELQPGLLATRAGALAPRVPKDGLGMVTVEERNDEITYCGRRFSSSEVSSQLAPGARCDILNLVEKVLNQLIRRAMHRPVCRR